MSAVAFPPEVEAVLAVAPEPVREAIRVLEVIGDRAVELGGRRPSPREAQRIILGSIARAGGTEDDVRFLVVHDLGGVEDLEEFRRKYPHAATRGA